MSTIKIYGGSDDLVCIGGDLSEEFNVITGPIFLLFNDGTQVKVTYDNGGIWRVSVITEGAAKRDLMLGLPDGAPERQCHGDEDAPSYSDVMTLTWSKPFNLVKRGRAKLSPPPPENKGALELVNKIIKHIENTRGGEYFLGEIDSQEDGNEDTYEDFKEGLIKILSSKAAPGARNTISGNVFVVTGTLSIPRASAVNHIEANGGEVVSSISSRVNYLVCGAEPGSKLDKAHELGIAVLSEAEFLAMLPT